VIPCPICGQSVYEPCACAVTKNVYVDGEIARLLSDKDVEIAELRGQVRALTQEVRKLKKEGE
jgi:post-segregation antitoxin (ccd killing protein)